MMSDENLKTNLLMQFEKLKKQALQWRLEFLYHYLTLAEQVMIEELILTQRISVK